METILQPPVVRCAHKKLMDPAKLSPHPMNPNTHSPKQIEMFIAILQFQGCRRPVTVSNRSGFVTKGHGQLMSYLEAGWKEVPVDYQDYDSDEEELADLVADNQLARMSEMNTGKLQEIGVQLDTGAFNMTLLGIEETKLEKLMTTVRTPPPTLTGIDGTPLVGAPGEQGEELPEGAEGSIANSSVPQASHVRMVQLFFTEETQQEFMFIIDYFQKELSIDNVTDCALEVLRSAYRAHQASQEQED